MTLLTTPLDALHRELGARMVPFAGYDMPVQYPTGIIREHLHTRAAAGLFDVSHMGQVIMEGAGSAALLESLVPVDIAGLGHRTARPTPCSPTSRAACWTTSSSPAGARKPSSWW